MQGDALLADIAEEIMSPGEGVIDAVVGLKDKGHGRGDVRIAKQALFDIIPEIGQFNDFTMADDNQQIIVAFIALGAAEIIDPVAAGIGAEQDKPL